ncbi:MAG: hypothetical protein GF320_06180, partial [Armatimonadia bacterium]|nr:hypothetical protein [Armatimonadia bacterium]
MQFWVLYRTIRRWIWLLLLLGIVAAGVTFVLVSFLNKPTHQAWAILRPPAEAAVEEAITGETLSVSSGGGRQEAVDTLGALLGTPRFYDEYRNAVRDRPELKLVSPEEFGRLFQVSERPGGLLELSFEGQDPADAARVAYSLVQGLQDLYENMETTDAERRLLTLEEQLYGDHVPVRFVRPLSAGDDGAEEADGSADGQASARAVYHNPEDPQDPNNGRQLVTREGAPLVEAQLLDEGIVVPSSDEAIAAYSGGRPAHLEGTGAKQALEELKSDLLDFQARLDVPLQPTEAPLGSDTPDAVVETGDGGGSVYGDPEHDLAVLRRAVSNLRSREDALQVSLERNLGELAEVRSEMAALPEWEGMTRSPGQEREALRAALH